MKKLKIGVRLIVALAVITTFVGCGDDDDEPAQTGDNPEESSTTADDAAEASPPNELAIGTAEFTFDLGGVTEIPAGALEMTVNNTGKEEHQAALFKLHEGETLESFGAAAAGEGGEVAALALVDGYGGPNSVAPGASATASSVVVEGDYVFLCFIPSPSDGVAHAEKGMVSPFTVTAAEEDGAGTTLDAPDGEIGLKEFAFDVPEDFTGDGTFAVVNNGKQGHEIGGYKLADGATAQDVLDFFAPGATPTGPPPISPAGGIVVLAPGSSGSVELSLEAGNYVFMCFVPDTDADGNPPHIVQGMIQEISIE